MEKIIIQKIESSFSDERGEIFNLLQNIGRIALITFTKDAIRGNHYHMLSTQYALVTKGEINITVFHIERPEKKETFCVGYRDMITIPPKYVHVFKAKSDAEIFDMMDKSSSITGQEDTFKYE